MPNNPAAVILPRSDAYPGVEPQWCRFLPIFYWKFATATQLFSIFKFVFRMLVIGKYVLVIIEQEISGRVCILQNKIYISNTGPTFYRQIFFNLKFIQEGDARLMCSMATAVIFESLLRKRKTCFRMKSCMPRNWPKQIWRLLSEYWQTFPAARASLKICSARLKIVKL